MGAFPIGGSDKKPNTTEGSASTIQEKHEPQVGGFKLKAKLKSSKINDLAEVLRSVSFLEIASEKDALNVIYVESRDINKNPYLFSITKFKEDELEVIYTIPDGISPRRRRFTVVRYLLNILSLVESSYSVETKTLFELIENTLKDLSSAVSMDYTKLYTSYDSLKKQVTDYKKKIDRLTQQNQALNSKNYELKAENDELKLRTKALEGLSEDALMAKLQEWIIEHSGSINISEFTKLYNLSDARVEEVLNKLVNEGYIEVVK
ncbi:MAG: hypothetical protein ABIJ10_01465 [Candidatus Micrarchaeota archaeon]